MTAPAVLSLRALNRTLLHRQHLLVPSLLSPLEMIEHLLGLQAQVPNPPYLALWTRLQHFEKDQLTRLMEERKVVRSAVMRSTLHLLTARDYLEVRPLVQPVLTRQYQGSYGRLMTGLDPREVATAGTELLTTLPRTSHDLGVALQQRWPDRDPRALSQAVRNHAALLHVPPAGTWNNHQNPRLIPAEVFLGDRLNPAPVLQDLVLRYLAAFGPATARDVSAWCGLTSLTKVLQDLHPQVRTLKDEQGRTLFDLADAVLPDADLPVPPRFLPDFDNILISHADRNRILPDGLKPRVFTNNGIVKATVLLDGFVAGLWKIQHHKDQATLQIELFADLCAADRPLLEEEGHRLLAFVVPEAERQDINIRTG